MKSIWPFYTKVKNQHEIIWINFVSLLSSMLYTKLWGSLFPGSGEDFHSAFTIFGPSRHLGQSTRRIWIKFRSRKRRRLYMYMKYDHNWPRGFRGEILWKCEFVWPWNKDQWYISTVSVPNKIHQTAIIIHKLTSHYFAIEIHKNINLTCS